MINKALLTMVIIFTFSSCSFGSNNETASTGSIVNISSGSEIKKENKKINEMTDKQNKEATNFKESINKDKAVDEFEKDVEDILKLLENNGK